MITLPHVRRSSTSTLNSRLVPCAHLAYHEMVRSVLAAAARNERRRRGRSSRPNVDPTYRQRAATEGFLASAARLGRAPSPPPELLQPLDQEWGTAEPTDAGEWPSDASDVEGDEWQDEMDASPPVFSNRIQLHYDAWRNVIPTLKHAYKSYTNDETDGPLLGRSCFMRACRSEQASILCVHLECRTPMLASPG